MVKVLLPYLLYYIRRNGEYMGQEMIQTIITFEISNCYLKFTEKEIVDKVSQKISGNISRDVLYKIVKKTIEILEMQEIIVRDGMGFRIRC